MKTIIDKVKELEIKKLINYLDDNPSKEKVLEELTKEQKECEKRLQDLKEPAKEYSQIDKLLQTRKYKEYNHLLQDYATVKEKNINLINQYKNKIAMIEDDADYDVDRCKVSNLIPEIEESKTIEEIALKTFFNNQEVSANKYLLAIVMLLQSIDLTNNKEDIDNIYNSFDLPNLTKKMEELDFENLLKSLKRIKIDIDDGFIQFIIMIINEKSLCTQENLKNGFPFLNQLEEDDEVPQNIRVAIEILEKDENKSKTIHEVGCEILIKEILSKIKED